MVSPLDRLTYLSRLAEVVLSKLISKQVFLSIFRCEADLNDSSGGLRLFREINNHSTTEVSDNYDENSHDYGRNHAFEASDDQDSAFDEDVSFQPHLG